MSTLVTGISGFVGTYLLDRIKLDTENTYYLLMRDHSFEKMKADLEDYPHLVCVRGSLRHPDLLTETENWKLCKKEVTQVIHLAALYDLSEEKEKLYLANVVGTQNVLFYCTQIKNLKKIVYASTIAVAGDFKGPFSEDDFDLGQEFDNFYAKTKFEAEGLVRKWSREHQQIQVDVLRFGVIVGDRQTGNFLKEDGPYFFFKNVSQIMERIPRTLSFPYVPFPFKGNSEFPIIPVDFVAESCLDALSKDHTGLRTYHVVVKDQPRLTQFLEDYLLALGFKMKVVALPESQTIKFGLKKILPLLQIPSEMVAYLYMPTQYSTIRYEKDFKKSLPRYNDFKEILFQKAIEVYSPLEGWGTRWNAFVKSMSRNKIK